jgi:hypothetical protein
MEQGPEPAGFGLGPFDLTPGGLRFAFQSLGQLEQHFDKFLLSELACNKPRMLGLCPKPIHLSHAGLPSLGKN